MFARSTPVSSPIVNTNINPSGHKHVTCDPYTVASHLRIFIPFRDAMTIVADLSMQSTL